MEILEKLPLRAGETFYVVSREESERVVKELAGRPAGYPISMLPRDVQERLRRGEPVAPHEIVPAPA